MSEQTIPINNEPGEQMVEVNHEMIRVYESGAVTSVNGKTGNVVLTYEDVGAIGDKEIIDFAQEDWDLMWN